MIELGGTDTHVQRQRHECERVRYTTYMYTDVSYVHLRSNCTCPIIIYYYHNIHINTFIDDDAATNLFNLASSYRIDFNLLFIPYVIVFCMCYALSVEFVRGVCSIYSSRNEIRNSVLKTQSA